ncbi:MAG: flagellar hook-length control protein FliK [Methylothermaceae bacterium]|nr:flagellar hook-length control protein FliK [Methylothermaceae bacterium]
MNIGLPRITLTPTPGPGALKLSATGLRVGERLEARVLAHPSPRQLLLEVGGRRLQAQTNLLLRPGDQLRLEVVRAGPQPHLKVLAQHRPEWTDQSALRHALPRQIPLDQALQNLKALFDRPQSQSLLPSSLHSQLKTLLHSLPRQAALSQADALQAAIRRSGLWAETLAASQHSPSTGSGDLKSHLLQLAAKISGHVKQTGTASPVAGQLKGPPSGHPSPTAQSELLAELGEKVSGALARIVLDQLASLPKPDNPTLTWHVEIPFRTGEFVQTLRLTVNGEKTAAKDPREKAPWTVDLEMDPPGLGRIRVKLLLQGENISSYWWGEKAHTARLLERHMDTLAQRFRSAGLQPERLQTLAEIEAQPVSESIVKGPLLDEKI